MTEEQLIELLACPICEERPKVQRKGDLLVCTLRGHGFKIVDGVPQMLPEDAIDPDKVKELLNES